MNGHISTHLDQSLMTIEICNANKLNAITLHMWKQMREIVLGVREMQGVQCVLIRGEGNKAFSAGADISEFATTRATYDDVVDFHENYVLACLKAISECPLPVVAAIRGACFGGGLEIALASDIRLCADDARFGAPVGRLGFPLAYAETQMLFRLLGPATAAELLIESRVLDGVEAERKGLVGRVVPVDDFEAAIASVVKSILANSNSANRSHKAQLRRVMEDNSPISYQERMTGYDFANLSEYRNRVKSFLD